MWGEFGDSVVLARREDGGAKHKAEAQEDEFYIKDSELKKLFSEIMEPNFKPTKLTHFQTIFSKTTKNNIFSSAWAENILTEDAKVRRSQPDKPIHSHRDSLISQRFYFLIFPNIFLIILHATNCLFFLPNHLPNIFSFSSGF